MRLHQYNWLIAAACWPFFSFKPKADTGITITLTGLRNNKGHVLISLYNSSAGFPEKVNNAVRRIKVDISKNTSSYTFSGLPDGTYAAAILHDENDDQKMNTNILGIPKEGYGFSNNVMGSLGPPSFSRASFSYTAGATITISIKTRYGF